MSENCDNREPLYYVPNAKGNVLVIPGRGICAKYKIMHGQMLLLATKLGTEPMYLNKIKGSIIDPDLARKMLVPKDPRFVAPLKLSSTMEPAVHIPIESELKSISTRFLGSASGNIAHAVNEMDVEW